MAPRARRAAKAGATNRAATAEDFLEHELGVRDPNAPKIVVMPEGMQEASRFIHFPRACDTSQTGLYLVCPEQGFFECTEVGKKSHHSWLLTPFELDDEMSDVEPLSAQVLQQPQYVVASRLDPLLVILPLMVAADAACPGMYKTLEDVLYDDANEIWEPLRDLLAHPSFSHLTERLEAAMKVVSDTLDLGCGEDVTYRLSLRKLHDCMLNKAIFTAELHFPASWEETFVKRALEVPSHDVIVSDEVKQEPDIKIEEGSQADSSTASQNTADSQTTAKSTSTAASSFTSQGPALVASDEVMALLRIQTVFMSMLQGYVPMALHDGLLDLLARTDTIDFEPLVEFMLLKQRKKLEMQALRELSDNISRKRKLDDDEEADKAEERKRKKDEDEARKKSTSQGVKKLMKADVTGMKKLSSFFTKKPST